jgi:hypothetical protein
MGVGRSNMNVDQIDDVRMKPELAQNYDFSLSCRVETVVLLLKPNFLNSHLLPRNHIVSENHLSVDPLAQLAFDSKPARKKRYRKRTAVYLKSVALARHAGSLSREWVLVRE